MFRRTREAMKAVEPGMNEFELHLPSGRTAGHRSLRTYYRQNLANYPTANERAEMLLLENERHDSDEEEGDDKQVAREIKRLEKAMVEHAKNLEFEQAARVRDQLATLKKQFFGSNGNDNVVPFVTNRAA